MNFSTVFGALPGLIRCYPSPRTFLPILPSLGGAHASMHAWSHEQQARSTDGRQRRGRSTPIEGAT